MIREVKFESQDRRIKQIIAALNANGIKDIEEANAICEAHGLDPYKTCEETQPICFENAKWAYVVGRFLWPCPAFVRQCHSHVRV